MEPDITINQLELGYESGHPVISGLTTTLSRGKIYGLLGLNGSGKTTLFKALAGLIKPQKGEIISLGYDPFKKEKEYLRQMIYVPINTKFPDMTIARFAKAYGILWPNFSQSDFEAMIENLNVDMTNKLNSLSTGEQKKCMVAFALSANTPLLMLDEPMTGLDIISRKMLLEAIVMNQKPEQTLIISSNQVEEFENIYTDILILYDGKLLINSTIDDITSKFAFHTHGSHPYTLFQEGLRSISLNRDNEYTDIDLQTLFYAACSSDKFRKTLYDFCSTIQTSSK